MPITWRTLPDHYGEPYKSRSRWIAISGDMEIGSVGPDTLSNNQTVIRWFLHGQQPASGRAATIDEGKAAVERAWWAWVKKAGLRDNPDAVPKAPPLSGPPRG